MRPKSWKELPDLELVDVESEEPTQREIQVRPRQPEQKVELEPVPNLRPRRHIPG